MLPRDLCTTLKKYLKMMDKSLEYILLSYNKYDNKCDDMLWLGLDDSFDVPEVKDPSLDDSVSINVNGGFGYISGSNERSILIGVYRYLRELGCAFVRPGEDGEIIPEVSLLDTNVIVFEAASYRHRSICIEGADSYDNINDFIKWMPKVGFNGFYNQFKVPFVFYDRWYLHKKNDHYKNKYQISVSDAYGLMNQSIYEIKKRSLLYHAVGHGWTCEPFGIEAVGWYNDNSVIDDNISKNFALVNGKREFWGGVPLNTNLCYSSKTVQERISSFVAEYSEKHNEVDYLHVWLADGSNNHCECDNCKKLLPSDYYVQLLNEIDKKLSEKNLSTKIVFLIYVDLLWAPIKERLNNPDRFVLMFAPITRTYSSDMVNCPSFKDELPKYSRNNNKMPSSVSENIAHLKNWQKEFLCDSFDFDYHLMWDHFKDIGQYDLAKVLFNDMCGLEKIGLNGMVSCQCIRSFFPHGLGMTAMASALWDKNADFDSVANKYFTDAFGKDGAMVCKYMKELSNLIEPSYLRGEYESTEQPELIYRFEQALKITEEFRDVINRNINTKNKTLSLSYRYLSVHNDFTKLFIQWEIDLASGELESADKSLDNLINYVKENEKVTQRVFDAYVFESTMAKCKKKIIKN